MASISSTIARQIGSLQGKLISQVESQVLSVLRQFSNQCPNAKELEKIIKIRSTLIAHIDSFQRRVDVFSNTADSLSNTISTISTIISTIKAIPLPTAIIPPMSGGIGIPISILTKYSDALVKLNKILDKLVDEVAAIKSTIASITPTLASLKSRLEAIDSAIQQCSKADPANLNQIIATTQPPENTGSEGVPSQDYLYKGYVLAIIQDPDSPHIAPKRYAIATDKAGIVRLRGDSSFSSSTQVLLDEIKFKIDNQLL